MEPGMSMWSALHPGESQLSYRSQGLSTYRSLRTFRSIDSIESQEETIQTNRTLRSLLQEIETRAENDEMPPEFVTSLSTLPPQLLQWDAKKLPPVTGRKKINIIGCHQPIELILSLADDRLRKQKKALDKAKQQSLTTYHQTLTKISHKHHRKKEMATQASMLKLSVLFLKSIQAVNYASTLEKQYRAHYMIHNWRNYMNRMAIRITRMLRRWANYALNQRRSVLQKTLSRNAWYFMMQFRILRKRSAATKLAEFLLACRGHQAIHIIISRYLKDIRKIQHVTRHWIACKQARVLALHQMWIHLERKFILKMLKRRMQKKVMRGAKARNLFEELNLNQKMRLELEKQSTQWDHLDAQIVSKLEAHRKLRGEAVVSLTDEQVQAMELPFNLRIEVLRELLEKVRRAFIRNQISKMSSFKDSDKQEFSVEDARDLLHNRPVRRAKSLVKTPLVKTRRQLVHPTHFPMLK